MSVSVDTRAQAAGMTLEAQLDLVRNADLYARRMDEMKALETSLDAKIATAGTVDQIAAMKAELEAQMAGIAEKRAQADAYAKAAQEAADELLAAARTEADKTVADAASRAQEADAAITAAHAEVDQRAAAVATAEATMKQREDAVLEAQRQAADMRAHAESLRGALEGRAAAIREIIASPLENAS